MASPQYISDNDSEHRANERNKHSDGQRPDWSEEEEDSGSEGSDSLDKSDVGEHEDA